MNLPGVPNFDAQGDTLSSESSTSTVRLPLHVFSYKWSHCDEMVLHVTGRDIACTCSCRSRSLVLQEQNKLINQQGSSGAT